MLKKFEKPDYDKLKQKLNRTHPRYLNHRYQSKDQFTCSSVCDFRVGGNLMCKSSTKKSDMDQYGPAMVLYFRFLKSTIYFVLLCAALNSFLVYLYNRAYSEANTESTGEISGYNFILNLRDITLSSSLGGYAQGSTRFYEANFTNASSLRSTLNNLTSGDPNVIDIVCPKGVLDTTPEYTYYGLVDSNFPSSYTFYMYVREFNNNTAFYESIKPCQGKPNCTVPYSGSWFTSGAAGQITGGNGNQYKLYMKYHCIDIKMDFFGKVYDKTKLNYVIVIINLLILGIFILYLINWSYYEANIFSRLRVEIPHASHYTLKIKNLPQHLTEEELAQRLHDHLLRAGGKLGLTGNFIVDINVAKNNSILCLDQLINKYNIKISAVIEKLVEDGAIELPPEGTPLDVKWVLEQRILNPSKFTEEKIKPKMESLLKSVKKLQTYEKKKENKEEKKETFQSVFVTFDTYLTKLKIASAMNITKFKRLSLKCGHADHICAFFDKVLRAKNPPEPENITWENLQVTPTSKKIRRTISWVVTILLIGVPIIVVILLSISLRKEEAFKFSCPSNGIFAENNMTQTKYDILIEDYRAKEKSENLMFCYCYEDFAKRLTK